MMKKEKKPHGVQLLIRAVVRDPDGKVISDTGRKAARSFVIQFLEFVCAFMNGVTTTATQIDGTEDTIYFVTFTPSDEFLLSAPSNLSTRGVQVGTGDTAEDNEDYKLDTQLTEGVGAGNITHGEVTYTSPSVVGVNVDMEITRSFTNNTGSTITVKEAGLVVRFGTISFYRHLIVRDVLVGSVDVPDMCSLTIYYTLRTTV